MTRIVPFDPTYNIIRKLEKVAFILLIISAAIITINWASNKFLDKETILEYTNLQDTGKVISYSSMVGYLIITLLIKVLFHTVEKRKRNDLIDNSFGTKYSDENTLGYYNNEEIKGGIKKLALNSYESSFHTENTLKLMILKNAIFLIGFSTLFLLSVFSKGGEDVIRLLFEISIPLTLISQFIILVIYYLNVAEINERFKIELTNIGNKELGDEDIPKLLILVMEYYNIKSWANTNLDSKIFKKNNNAISKKWENRKQTFR